MKEGFHSFSDGLKRGVCASHELETRMRAAYDRVGCGIENLIGGTCSEMLQTVFLFFKFLNAQGRAKIGDSRDA